MTAKNKFIFGFAISVIVVELSLLVFFYPSISQWLKHHWWVIILPFTKMIVKRLFALKLIVFFKMFGVLLWHLSKLFLLKLFKTLGLRYGLFFSQRRWYAMRKAKVMFLRRGKQFFRKVSRFWGRYDRWHKVIILVAFFPFCLVLFLLGLSFNVTRKTIVQKTQETALVKMATNASNKNKGIRGFITRLDKKTLDKIKSLSS